MDFKSIYMKINFVNERLEKINKYLKKREEAIKNEDADIEYMALKVHFLPPYF
jgi:hypothetical protein